LQPFRASTTGATGIFPRARNVQFNWIKLEDAPAILADLANVEMHANQTSGNCIRNITCDEFAGVAQDEIVDPRPYAEILRQWSTFHPEFAYLPRKFKIAITGASEDRAATAVHDIGLTAVKNAQGEVGFRVLVGGGLGRTPILGTEIRDFVPWQHVITLYRVHRARIQRIWPPRQSLQGAHQDFGEGDRHRRIQAPRGSRLAIHQERSLHDHGRGVEPCRGIFYRPRL